MHTLICTHTHTNLELSVCSFGFFGWMVGWLDGRANGRTVISTFHFQPFTNSFRLTFLLYYYYYYLFCYFILFSFDLVEKHLLIECSRVILCMFTDKKKHNSPHKSVCARTSNKCVQRIASTTIILPIINRIEAANGNLNVEASAKTDCKKTRCK